MLPIGIETLGSFGPHAQDFIKDIGHRIAESTGEKKSTSYADHWNGNLTRQQLLHTRNRFGLQEVR